MTTMAMAIMRMARTMVIRVKAVAVRMTIRMAPTKMKVIKVIREMTIQGRKKTARMATLTVMIPTTIRLTTPTTQLTMLTTVGATEINPPQENQEITTMQKIILLIKKILATDKLKVIMLMIVLALMTLEMILLVRATRGMTKTLAIPPGTVKLERVENQATATLKTERIPTPISPAEMIKVKTYQ